MKVSTIIAILSGCFAAALSAHGQQGAFQNLNFEQANPVYNSNLLGGICLASTAVKSAAR
jgi:hypothetical protein